MTAKANILTCDFSDLELYNRKYIPLFDNKSEFLHLFGSAGSGKSRFIAQKEIVLSFDWQRRNRKTLIIRKVATTLKDSAYSELKTVLYEWGIDNQFEILKSPLSITNKLTNVQMLFMGLDDPEKVKSISGVDRIWIEEATELNTLHELEQLRLRLRGFNEVQITLSYNPIDEHHWLNEEIHIPRKIGHFLFHSTYLDNEKLKAKDPNYFNYLDSLEGNYARVYKEGLWGRVIEGLIYEHYTIIDEFPKDSNGNDDIHFYGLDFGFSDPTALVAQHIKDALPKKKLINKEILYKTGLDGIGLVREFDSLGIRKDIQIVADSARPEMIKSLTDAGYKAKGSEKFAGSVLSGINEVRKYELEIVAGSKNMIKEINNYQKRCVNGIWFEEPAPNQVDHTLDGGRYGLETVKIPPFEIDDSTRKIFSGFNL
jgi:phage terminase large subunit